MRGSVEIENEFNETLMSLGSMKYQGDALRVQIERAIVKLDNLKIDHAKAKKVVPDLPEQVA